MELSLSPYIRPLSRLAQSILLGVLNKVLMGISGELVKEDVVP